MKFIPILITALVFLITLFTVEYRTQFFRDKLDSLKQFQTEQRFLGYSKRSLEDFESKGAEITQERLEDYQLLQKRILVEAEQLGPNQKRDLYKSLSHINNQMLSFEGYEE